MASTPRSSTTPLPKPVLRPLKSSLQVTSLVPLTWRVQGNTLTFTAPVLTPQLHTLIRFVSLSRHLPPLHCTVVICVGLWATPPKLLSSFWGRIWFRAMQFLTKLPQSSATCTKWANATPLSPSVSGKHEDQWWGAYYTGCQTRYQALHVRQLTHIAQPTCETGTASPVLHKRTQWLP